MLGNGDQRLRSCCAPGAPLKVAAQRPNDEALEAGLVRVDLGPRASAYEHGLLVVTQLRGKADGRQPPSSAISGCSRPSGSGVRVDLAEPLAAARFYIVADNAA